MRRKELVLLVVAFVLWRGALFGLGYAADFFLPYHPSFPYAEAFPRMFHIARWIFSWANFDGIHYLTIGRMGYIGTGLVQAFFPLYPLLLLHSYYVLFLFFTGQKSMLLIAGLVCANIAALAATIQWFSFVQARYSTRTAWLATVILLFFPTSFFFGAVYTESLFFFFIIFSFAQAQKKHWLLATIGAGLAVSTRVVGIFLIPALMIELYTSTDTKDVVRFFRLEWKRLALFCFASVGLVLYMAFLTHEFHDPFYFLHVQAAFGGGRQSSFVSYPQVVWRYLKILKDTKPHDFSSIGFVLRYYSYVQEFLISTAGLLLLVCCWKKVRLSWLFFSLAAFLLPTVTGTFSSMPRYALASFAGFLLLARYGIKHQVFRISVLVLFAFFCVVNTILFVQGYWVA